MECPVCSEELGSLCEAERNRHVEDCISPHRKARNKSSTMGDAEEEEYLLCFYDGCEQLVSAVEWEDHLFAHQLEASESLAASLGREEVARTLQKTSNPELDDLSTCTKGILSCLEHHYTTHHPKGVTSVSLSGDTWHLCSAPRDIGWGCGYRNMQMVMSCLLQLEPYKSHLAQKGVCEVLSILKLQEMIEEAWSQGFDAKGCEELHGKVCKTKKWIGTTEAASVFRNLNLRAQVVDFANPTGERGTHPKVFEWVRDYFHGGIQAVRDCQILTETSCDAGKCARKEGTSQGDAGKCASMEGTSQGDAGKCASMEGTSQGDAGKCASMEGTSQGDAGKCASMEGTSSGCTNDMGSKRDGNDDVGNEAAAVVSATSCPPEDLDFPPLYFQHEGHSRTIIGVEERGTEMFLLLLDPLQDVDQMGAILRDPVHCLRLLRKSVNQIKRKEYEIVFVDGLLTDGEKEAMKIITPFQRIT